MLAAAATALMVTVALDCRTQWRKGDPLGPNAACYVCHMTFVGEYLSAVHLNARIGCTHCHGASAGHANDENIGATPPDVVIERGQVNSHCRKCHKTHDVAPEALIARWQEHTRMNRPAKPLPSPVVCTDCHGEHKIAKRSDTRGAPLPSGPAGNQ